jgi:DNA-binding NarL/FixJ family response regulator
MSTSQPAPVSRILIVDDHPLFRQGLRELIDREPGWEVCGEAADAAEATRLVEETKPDLVIIDISLGATNGIDLIKNLNASNADLTMLVVSMHDESLYTERALRAGAMGYVMKHEPAKTFKTAIHRVLGGEMYLSERIAASLVAKLMRPSAEPEEKPITLLSGRELEVFRMLGEGKGTRQIAETLDLSIATINSFRARIKEKLGLKTSTELMLNAIHWVKEQGDRNAAPGL